MPACVIEPGNGGHCAGQGDPLGGGCDKFAVAQSVDGAIAFKNDEFHATIIEAKRLLAAWGA